MPWDDLDAELADMFDELSGSDSIYAQCAPLSIARAEITASRQRAWYQANRRRIREANVAKWWADPEGNRAESRDRRALRVATMGLEAVRAYEADKLARSRAKLRADPERYKAHKAKEIARVSRYVMPPEVRERKNAAQRARRAAQKKVLDDSRDRVHT